MGKLGIIIPIEAIIYGVIWYFAQPAISLESLGFCGMIILALIFIWIAALSVIDDCMGDGASIISWIAGGGVGVVIALILAMLLFTSPLFMAKSYAQLYEDSLIVEKEMSEYKATLDNIPLTDKDTANKLIMRKMGSLKGDLVSQFNSGNPYQITYNGESYRVAPLVYAGFFQWKNNSTNGIPAYVKTNMETEETEIEYLERGMKYSPSEMFGRDLKRYLRSNYPSAIFDEFSFELDEEGNPYWIAPVVEHKIGLFAGRDIKGVIVVNAINGDHEYYDVDDTPEWVDNVYPTDILVEQYDYYGKYQDGFLNSVFAKKNATETTDGYNYIPDDHDVNIYTGVTSLVMDESNVGFVLMNKRTKEATYYEYAGAEEYSAMSSAEGLVQQYGYTATFPLLVNLEEEPTYYMALKDAGGLVKGYALVNVQEYQKAVYADTLKEAISKYLSVIGKNSNIETPENDGNIADNPVLPKNEYTKEITGIVKDIRMGDINGTTYFYVALVDGYSYYKISLAESEGIILLNVGDEITLLTIERDGKIINAKIK